MLTVTIFHGLIPFNINDRVWRTWLSVARKTTQMGTQGCDNRLCVIIINVNPPPRRRKLFAPWLSFLLMMLTKTCPLTICLFTLAAVKGWKLGRGPKNIKRKVDILHIIIFIPGRMVLQAPDSIMLACRHDKDDDCKFLNPSLCSRCSHNV